MLTIVRRYDPLQPRDAGGRWGAGMFDMSGFDNVIEIEGTFGSLAMGVDAVGDVRIAFHEGGEPRELDLGAEDIADLDAALTDLVTARDDLPPDADPRGVYEDAWFGSGSEYKAELYGSGVIGVIFGAGDEDPWTLTLDPPDDGEDDVQTFSDALAEVLQGGPVDVVERKFNPAQARLPGGDDGGQWTATGALRDTLKLDGRIQLGPGERLVGSGRVDADQGGIRMAVIDRAGRRMVRFGVGGEQYGQRNREAGTVAWDGNPTASPLSQAERERLKAEDEALGAEYDTAGPDRQAAIDERLDEITEALANDGEHNGTASLDEYSVRRLVDRIRPALAEAIDQHRTEQDAWAEIDRLEEAGDFDPARMAELRRIARADNLDFLIFTSGIVPGSEWGDVHFTVAMDDDEPYVTLGVMPKDAPDGWAETRDWQGTFSPADMRKFFRLADRAFQDAERSRSPENGDAPAGGQFAPGGGRVGSKGKGGRPPRRRGAGRPAAPSGPLKFDGKTGTGYGVKGGDARVRGLQAAMTRLGITDSDGKPLAPDGKYGPKTTSAVKKLQKALGLKQDGQATPELLKQATELKQLPSAKSSTPRKRTKSTRRSLLATVNRALRLGVEVRHPLLFDRAFALDDIQISRSGDGRTVEAYAACFDQPYEVRDQHGHYMEVIDRAAFNRTLSNGAGRQAMCLYNHGMSVVDGKPDSLAQVPIGTPLEIVADGRGLKTVTRYNRSPLADHVLEAVRDGSIRSQSFRGRIVRSSPDRIPARSRTGGLPTITRHELGLTDYGPTPIPVNANAEIMAVRSLTELARDFAALDDDGRLELLRTLGIDPDGDDDEDPQDEAPFLGDDTPTSTVELGAEDPPLTRHSGRQIETQRRIRAAMISRGMR